MLLEILGAVAIGALAISNPEATKKVCDKLADQADKKSDEFLKIAERKYQNGEISYSQYQHALDEYYNAKSNISDYNSKHR